MEINIYKIITVSFQLWYFNGAYFVITVAWYVLVFINSNKYFYLHF